MMMTEQIKTKLSLLYFLFGEPVGEGFEEKQIAV
jgi:hypothetical protein